MESESTFSEFSSFFDRLRRERDLPPIIPFIMGLAVAGSAVAATPDPQNSDQDQPSAARPPVRAGRLVVIDQANNSMVVIQSGSGGIDSLMRELAKDGHPPASKASIAAMPTVKVAEASGECPICLDQFEVGGEAKEMPCKHVFHGGCVEKWLKAHGTCPVCRYTMPADEEEEPEKKNGNEDEISVSIFVRATPTTRGSDQSADDVRDDDDEESRSNQAESEDGGDDMQS